MAAGGPGSCGDVRTGAISPGSWTAGDLPAGSRLGGFTFWQKCEFYKVLLICSAYNLSIDGNEN